MYIDVLEKIVENYNSRPHRGLNNTAAKEVSENNKVSLWNDMYINSLQKSKTKSRKAKEKANKKFVSLQNKNKYSFNIGQLVRISYAKSPFQHSYRQTFMDEVFLVTARYFIDSIPVYKLADLQNEPIEGPRYLNMRGTSKPCTSCSPNT